MFGRLTSPFRSFGFVALAIALLSCEGNTRLEWNLQNDSSEAVYVVHKAWDYSSIPPDTVSVAAGETYLLGVNDILGGNSIPWDPASFIDTLFVTSCYRNVVHQGLDRYRKLGNCEPGRASHPVQLVTHLFLSRRGRRLLTPLQVFDRPPFGLNFLEGVDANADVFVHEGCRDFGVAGIGFHA